MSHHRETINAPGAPAAAGPYSHGVRASGLIFLSGQTPLDPGSNELVGGSTGDQARRCLENLTAVAEAAGASLGDAVRMTIYLTDMSTFAEVNQAYGAFFPTDPPARTTIGVAALPLGAQVEMDAVLAVPD